MKEVLRQYSDMFTVRRLDDEALMERDRKAAARNAKRKANKPAEAQKKANRQKRKAAGQAQAYSAGKKAAKKAAIQYAAKFAADLPPEGVEAVKKAGYDAFLKHLFPS